MRRGTTVLTTLFFFSKRMYFIRISRLKYAKFVEYLNNKPDAEISKRTIILSDENLRIFFFQRSRIKLLLPPTAKLPNKTKKPALVIAKCSLL